jgi:hypothetical protein
MPVRSSRILSTFDWFVVLVVLGYLLVVVQGMWQSGASPLPFTPSSQLQDDARDPPADLSNGSAVSMRTSRVRISEIE